MVSSKNFDETSNFSPLVLASLHTLSSIEFTLPFSAIGNILVENLKKHQSIFKFSCLFYLEGASRWQQGLDILGYLHSAKHLTNKCNRRST